MRIFEPLTKTGADRVARMTVCHAIRCGECPPGLRRLTSDGRRTTERQISSAGEHASIWAMNDARHIKGIAAEPQAYEHRVISFFDNARLGR
jgi:hypothetical protein